MMNGVGYVNTGLPTLSIHERKINVTNKNFNTVFLCKKGTEGARGTVDRDTTDVGLKMNYNHNRQEYTQNFERLE